MIQNKLKEICCFIQNVKEVVFSGIDWSINIMSGAYDEGSSSSASALTVKKILVN